MDLRSPQLVTTAGLIQAARQRGVDISERAVADWVVRDLLPHRQQLGRGPGKGKLYYWDDPRVIEQAVTVKRLLTSRPRAKARLAYLPLLGLGFRVPAKRLRPSLQEWLDEFTLVTSEDAIIPEELSLLIEELLLPRGRNEQPFANPKADLVMANVLLNPDLKIRPQDVKALGWNDPGAIAGAKLMQKYASAPAMQKSLEQSSDEEIEEVISDWLELRPWMLEALAIFIPADSEVWHMGMGASRGLLPFPLLVDLAARRSGQAAQIDQFVRRAIRLFKRIAAENGDASIQEKARVGAQGATASIPGGEPILPEN